MKVLTNFRELVFFLNDSVSKSGVAVGVTGSVVRRQNNFESLIVKVGETTLNGTKEERQKS